MPDKPKGGSVRQRLADDADANYEMLNTTLKAAAQAVKTVWHSCRHCGKRDQVEIPDAMAAAKAAEIWLREGFGRPRETSGASGDFVLKRTLALSAGDPMTITFTDCDHAVTLARGDRLPTYCIDCDPRSHRDEDATVTRTPLGDAA
jgi:hypothetical protein